MANNKILVLLERTKIRKSESETSLLRVEKNGGWWNQEKHPNGYCKELETGKKIYIRGQDSMGSSSFLQRSSKEKESLQGPHPLPPGALPASDPLHTLTCSLSGRTMEMKREYALGYLRENQKFKRFEAFIRLSVSGGS